MQPSPAHVGGQTTAGLQPDTDSFHWTKLGPDGSRAVPGTDTGITTSLLQQSTPIRANVQQTSCENIDEVEIRSKLI